MKKLLKGIGKLLQSRKLQYAVGTLALRVLADKFPSLPPEIAENVVALGISLIAGHTFTDIAALLKGKKEG